MDMIISLADEFSRRFICNGSRPIELIESAKSELLKIYEPLEKIKFLQYIIDENIKSMESHLVECKHQHCARIQNHQKIDYFLSQELKSLGVFGDKDSFASTEKIELNKKIDKILCDLQDLKDGQRIIYEDLSDQLTELKNLYFLGKKKWHQIMVGKVLEMTLSGIISQSLSKDIITGLYDISKQILNQ